MNIVSKDSRSVLVENRIWDLSNKKQEYVSLYRPTVNMEVQYNLGSDRLQAGRPRVRNLGPCRVKIVRFSTSSRPALGSTQPPIQ
jgi:hypothetical protein